MINDNGRDPAFRSGFATNKGLVRPANEDNCVVREDVGVWVVADGMGGHEAGAYASQVIVDALGRVAADPNLDAKQADALARLWEANATILDFATQKGGITVGSTVVMLVLSEKRYVGTWCGDSRIYRVRRNTIEQVSHDHTAVQDFIDQGVLTREEGKVWPNRNVLTRAVGVGPSLEADTCTDDLEEGDVFVLCSDGLTAHVEDDEIRLGVRGRPPQSACEHLIALALQRGGKDNVTVVVVQYRPEVTRRVPRPALP